MKLSRSIRWISYLLVALSFVPLRARAQTVFVPLNHPAYDFIERMETRGGLTRVLNGTRPMTRAEIGRYLVQLWHQPLSRVDQDHYTFLLSEFREELPESLRAASESRLARISSHPKLAFLPDLIYKNQRNLVVLEHQQFRAYGDAKFCRSRLFARADSLTGSERVFEDSNGFLFWGTLGQHLGFSLDVRDTKEWGTRQYPRRYEITHERYGFANGYGSHIYHDETVAFVNFSWSWLELQLGKDSNRWGPGFRGQLALSDYATSYDLIKLQVQYWRFKLTGLTGFLRQYPRVWINGLRRDRVLAAHRLEFSPAKWLDLGFHETVVYFDPEFEWSYLNPVSFYRAQEHYLGDQGNAGMGLDFEWLSLPKTKVYGEFFLDDINTAKLGTGWRGNKYGYTLGLYHVDLFGIDNLDARGEFTRVRPYTYSHRDSLNVYKHFSTVLGHRIGPNAENFYFGISYQPHWRLVIAAGLEQLRHGVNEPGRNVGGDLNRPHQSPDPDYIEFLSGLKSTTRSFEFKLSYHLIRMLFLRARCAYFAVQRDPRDWLPWEDLQRTEASVGFDFNF